MSGAEQNSNPEIKAKYNCPVTFSTLSKQRSSLLKLVDSKVSRSKRESALVCDKRFKMSFFDTD